jgi:hypothetical protein
MGDVAAARGEGDPETRSGWGSALAVWRRRLVADQALEKVCSIIHIRQYDLDSLIRDARARRVGGEGESAEVSDRLARAEELVAKPVPAERAAANELLDKLDCVLPLIVDAEQLRLMLQTELDRDEQVLSKAARERAIQLLESGQRGDEGRRQLELFVTAAVRERNDRMREAQFTADLRQNYLTWLGTVLLLLLAGVAAMAMLAARFGLWADILLAILSGALGGTLSGVIRLRVPEHRLAALKNLGPVMLVQPLVGAVGGIILFAIWRSGVLSVSGLKRDEWASVAVVAFAGGFSERLFLKSLARIGGGEPIEATGPPPAQ